MALAGRFLVSLALAVPLAGCFASSVPDEHGCETLESEVDDFLDTAKVCSADEECVNVMITCFAHRHFEGCCNVALGAGYDEAGLEALQERWRACVESRRLDYCDLCCLELPQEPHCVEGRCVAQP
jgi:hypothetical protein